MNSLVNSAIIHSCTAHGAAFIFWSPCRTSHKTHDHYLPFLDHGAHLVTGEVHAVEVGEAVLALDILGDEFELAEGHLVVLQISKAHLEHTSLKTI